MEKGWNKPSNIDLFHCRRMQKMGTWMAKQDCLNRP